MKREGKTARSRVKEGGGTGAAPGFAASVLCVLDSLCTETSPERGFHTAIEAAAGGTRGAVSLWRLESDDPVLLAAAGDGRGRPDEEMLAAMKETAREVSSNYAPGCTDEVKADRHGASKAGQGYVVERFKEKWGVLVARPGEVDGEGSSFLGTLAKTVGLIAEKAALHDEVAHLRGKVAASESERDPMARYARLGQLARRAHEELARVLDSVEKTLGKGLRVPVKAEIEEALEELRGARSILKEQMELADLEMPVLAMNSLSEIVQGSVKEMEAESGRKNMRILKRIDPMLSPLLLDSDKVRMAVDKVLATAVARSETDGWLKIETEAGDDEARIQITWEEKGTPGALTQDMYLPFGPLGKGGAGLAVASQIIREHGGGVCVKRFSSGTTALIVRFPIGANQDRRRRKSRRSGLDRRLPRRGTE